MFYNLNSSQLLTDRVVLLVDFKITSKISCISFSDEMNVMMIMLNCKVIFMRNSCLYSEHVRSSLLRVLELVLLFFNYCNDTVRKRFSWSLFRDYAVNDVYFFLVF